MIRKSAIALGFLAPQIAFAAESAMPMVPTVGKVLLALIAVVGCILMIAWSAKKGNILTKGSKLINIVDSASFGPKEKVAVIEVEGKRMLVGVTAGSINLLADVSSAESDDKAQFINELSKVMEKAPK